MPAGLFAKRLCRGKRVVEVITRQSNFDLFAAKSLCFQDLLLWRRHGHKNNAAHAEVFAHKCDTLGVIAGAGTHKQLLIGGNLPDLAHGIERAAQFIRADRRQILALEPDVGGVPVGQKGIVLQRCGRKDGAHQHFGGAGSGCEICHKSG